MTIAAVSTSTLFATYFDGHVSNTSNPSAVASIPEIIAGIAAEGAPKQMAFKRACWCGDKSDTLS